jgi:cation diffusion facilitator CzcD-associated flavoprotein CzcO
MEGSGAVVVGAGHAGLAISQHLRRGGIEHVVLNAVGSASRGAYSAGTRSR